MRCDCDWCPIIPDNWKQVRIKDIALLKSGDTFTSEQLGEDAVYPVYGGNGLRGFTDFYNKDGDYVLIGRQGALCGNINYAHGRFFATEHAVVVNTYKDENITWLGETLRSANYNRLSNSAAQPGLSVAVLMNQFIPYPPKEVRDKIGLFLDAETAKIDHAIELLKKKREAYTQLKSSVINSAVTRGLNPNVKLKDSGVEWIGMIPEGWDWHRLKDLGYMYSGLTGKSGDDFRSDDLSITKPYIPFTNVLNHIEIDPNQMNFVVMDEGEMQNRVIKGDLIFLMSSEDYESIAKSALVSEDIGEAYLNSFCRGYRFTKTEADAKFVNYELNSELYRNAIRYEARGFTRINIKVDRIETMLVILPPLSEQHAITDYLDSRCARIDKASAIVDKQIDAYTRLKKSLINEVVTGKRKV